MVSARPASVKMRHSCFSISGASLGSIDTRWSQAVFRRLAVVVVGLGIEGFLEGVESITSWV